MKRYIYDVLSVLAGRIPLLQQLKAAKEEISALRQLADSLSMRIAEKDEQIAQMERSYQQQAYCHRKRVECYSLVVARLQEKITGLQHQEANK